MLDSSKMVVVTSEVVGVEEILYESFDSLFGKSWKRLKSTILVQYLFKTILLKIIQNGHLCGQESTWFYSKANLTLTQFDFEPPTQIYFPTLLNRFSVCIWQREKIPVKYCFLYCPGNISTRLHLMLDFFFQFDHFNFFGAVKCRK